MKLTITRTDWTEASTVLATAARFFVRHYPVMLGLGAVASVQRFLAVGGDERFTFADGVAGELVTGAARVLLLAWLVRRAFADTDIPWAEVGPRLAGYGRHRTGVVLASVIMLLGLTVVAKVIPDAIGAGLTDSRASYSAWELAIKNVTVIPFTMVWLTIASRHALRGAAHVSAS